MYLTYSLHNWPYCGWSLSSVGDRSYENGVQVASYSGVMILFCIFPEIPRFRGERKREKEYMTSGRSMIKNSIKNQCCGLWLAYYPASASFHCINTVQVSVQLHTLPNLNKLKSYCTCASLRSGVVESTKMGISLYVTLVVVGVLSALLYTPVKRGVVVLGFLRPIESWQNVHGIENRVIEDTVACEDLHYHEPSGMLYSACGGDLEKAATWFPGYV